VSCSTPCAVDDFCAPAGGANTTNAHGFPAGFRRGFCFADSKQLLNATCSVRLTCTMPHTSVTIRRPRSRSCGRSRTFCSRPNPLILGKPALPPLPREAGAADTRSRFLLPFPDDIKKALEAVTGRTRVLLSRASQSQGRSHQRQRPGRDVGSRWSAGIRLSCYAG
jgi:hypothetical protein